MNRPRADVDIASPAFSDDPYREYRRLTDAGPVHEVAAGENSWTIVTDFEVGRAVLRHPAFSKALPRRLLQGSTGGAERPSMLGSDPPRHTRLKGAVSPFFSEDSLHGLQGKITQRSRDLITGIRADLDTGTGVDLRVRYAMPFAFGTLADILGIGRHVEDDLHTWTIRMLSPAQDEAEAHAQAAAVAAIRALVLGLITEARSAGRSTGLLIRHLATASGPDALDDDEIVTMVTLLLAAGYQGTANLILNGLLALLADRGQWKQVVAGPDLVDDAVAEALRFDCPVQRATLRVVTADVEVAGVSFSTGELVGVSLAAANRDPKRFADPDTFDLARPRLSNLAFSHGVHHCLGAGLARAEARTAFADLSRLEPDLRLDTRHGPVRWAPTGLLRGPESLWVTRGAAA